MAVTYIPAGYEDDLDDDDDDVYSIDGTIRNLKITIVPDITTGAGLNGENFDCKLSLEMDSWFDAFRERWKFEKRSPSAQQSLKMVFLTEPEPLRLALKFFALCPGCNNLKNKNLALFIIETICDLHKQQPDISSTCDDNTRMIAFNFVKTCGIAPLCKAVMETYELRKLNNLLVPKIRELISQGYVKDAAYWAMNLEVANLFGIFDIVFPLILQDKVSLAEKYLSGVVDQQLPTVQYLDSLLDRRKTVVELCDEILVKYNYRDVRDNFLSYRPMSKLVTRLAKKYKIDAHLTPNLNYTKACSYIHYLYRKYQDGGMSFESWRELVRDAASTEPLQMDLVENITSYGDYKEAIYWAKLFKIPRSNCPKALQAEFEHFNSDGSSTSAVLNVSDSSSSSTGARGTKSKTNVCTRDEYLSLELPTNCIVLVDDKQKFLEMLSYLEKQSLVAFDSEWKPSVCNDNVVSVLQLATYERVYLLDCLSGNLSEEMWQILGNRLFNNLEILKIGFSLHQDLCMLHKSLPLQLSLNVSACYLDLRELWRRLKYMEIVKHSLRGAYQSGESLCALTQVCLGKKLDKSNQCSNWANRPLRHDQIIYAALDAHCLLRIYQVLTELLLRIGLDMDQVIDDITKTKTGYLSRMRDATFQQNVTKKTVSGRKKRTKVIKNNIVLADSVRFICDSMLFGISKELRKLGIDCINITNLNVNSYIEMAKREHRYVLTRGARYTLFTNELPHSQCIQLPSDSSVEQLLTVMDYLKIEVHRRNLFTRCLLCNSNEFILTSKTEMQLLRFGEVLDGKKKQTKSTCTAEPYDRTFSLLYPNEHIYKTKKTYKGKPIKLNRIQPHIFRSKEYFYICDNCGVCTWDGAHTLHPSIWNLIVTNGNLSAMSSSSSISNSDALH